MSRLCATFLTLALMSCGHPLPIRINSDPNQEALDRLHDQTEADDVEIFIHIHPELDAQTRRDLRDGTVSRRTVAERLRRQKTSGEGR